MTAASTTLSNGILLGTGAGTLALILWAVPRFPHLSPADIRRGQLILSMLGIRTAVGFPMTVFGAATTARQRFALNNMVATVVALANGAVLLLIAGGMWVSIRLHTSAGFFEALSFLGYIEVFMVIINLVPIPPLDGFGILRPWLPYSIQGLANRLGMSAMVLPFEVSTTRT